MKPAIKADWKTKVEAIEHIDKFVVGPVLEKLRTYPQWRILVLPDHPTNIATRKVTAIRQRCSRWPARA